MATEEAQLCYPLTGRQLRDLWDYDNEMGNKMFNIPIRRCSKREAHVDSVQVDDKSYEDMKKSIDQMWRSAAIFFEFFKEEEKPHLGYRLRVRKDVPCRINFSAKDYVIMGWTSAAPTEGLCAHLYNRSPIKQNGYMGGPASYLNWNGRSPSVQISRSYKGPSSFIVYCKASNLKAGMELTWDYGSKKSLPEFQDWFLAECCSLEPETKAQHIPIPRAHPRTVEDPAYIWKEMCSLCGNVFMTEKSKRLQRKPHYVDSHADYFGTDWDGLVKYDPKLHEIDGNRVLVEAEFLNTVISQLHSLKWRVIPACKVLTDSEWSNCTMSSEIMELFRNKCKILKEGGILVLRGGSAPTCVEHLSPVPVCQWKHLNWMKDTQPPRGRYSTTVLSSTNYSPQDRVMELAMKLISYDLN